MRLSLDAMLQDSRRKRAEENRAQAILGSRSRQQLQPQSQHPPRSLNSSIASRAGIPRRTASGPRPRPPPSNNTRSNRPRESHSDDYYDAPPRDLVDTRPPPQSLPARRPANPPAHTNGNGNARPAPRITNTNSFNVRGAASEQYIVIAENFAPGTTAADIESVMIDAGGEVNYVRLINGDPVIAEMSFVKREGAETVIDTFDGKKADGIPLTVYWQGQRPTNRDSSPPAVGFVVDTEPIPDDTMEVDEQAREREEQNRLREERRGPAPRDPANDTQRDGRDRPRGGGGGYPSGPSADRRCYGDNRGSSYNGGGRRYDGGGGGGGGGGGRQYASSRYNGRS
ncbi:uncharacterized protein RCC_01565 [Ramularia collo-cygni]|uniref:RRM domain-containing protein n=1 Tax=Ramularia collo-cygni TaxID=112498 RepID=A0A2D3UMU5_9PEZI|nr:uncharacterized protein RCC_01565 [Ramularia collo-cygni]CZT15731.1 uncharacterized protein RCC_01565 [Ramularia collo-cygni]